MTPTEFRRSVMSDEQAKDAWLNAGGGHNGALAAAFVLNEFVRRLGEMKEGCVWDVSGAQQRFASRGDKHDHGAIGTSSACRPAVLFIRPETVKPKRSDAERIEAALKIHDDAHGYSVCPNDSASCNLARILRGEA